MPDGGLLVHLITALGAALAGAAIALRLRQPLIVGYVLAGVVIGPFTPGIVGSVEATSDLAEVGIVLLMFVIGVQLSLRSLVRESRIVVAGGLLQVAVMLAVGILTGRALGWSPLASYVFGAVISNSSSTVLAKILSDRGELDSRHARLGLAWSSVQDLSTVVLVAALTFVSPGAAEVAPMIGKAAVFFLVLLPLAFWFLPRLLGRAMTFQNREFFALTVVTLALAMAGGASLLGVSLALGAFLTGIVLGESDLAHRILGDAIPLRDVFAGVFFVAIGMLLDPRFVIDSWPLVLLTVALIVVIKGATTVALAYWLSGSLRLALLIGAGLAQSAEFSFLLARIGLEAGALTTEIFNLLLSATIMTIVLSPWVNALAPVALRRIRVWWPSAAHDVRAPAPQGITGHAIVCGYGRVGSIVCRLLDDHRKPLIVIEEDARLVDDLRTRGITALLGDAGMPHVLERAHIRNAYLLVLSIPERMAVRRALDYAREVNDKVAVLARTHSHDDRVALLERGADQAVVGELELGLALGRRALERLEVDPELIAASIARLRQSGRDWPGTERACG